MSTEASIVSELETVINNLQLVDHHVHGALAADVRREDFEQLITESDRPLPDWMTQFDSQVGFAIRRWCAPILGLEPHDSPEGYLARRTELGVEEVNRRFLRGAGIGRFLVETGYQSELILDLEAMASASGHPTDEVVRLEAVADAVAQSGVEAAKFAERFKELLWARSKDAVGLKSIVAYRYGLDFNADRPSQEEVESAAGRWLRDIEVTGLARVKDPVLLRYLIWTGVDRGLPLQFRVGYGDPDVELHRCDPLLMTKFIKQVAPNGVPIMLLHCYPYHRHAGYLAQVFSNVYFDVGLAINYLGAGAIAVLAESLELAPFGKLLFSTDAWGPAELHYLGALLWRRGINRVLQKWVDAGEWSQSEASRIAGMIGVENARRVYELS